MFEDLFTYPKVLARHRMAPAAADRERYLAHCADQGIARVTLARIAQELLVVAERLDVTAGKLITPQEVEAAAQNWARHQQRRQRIGSGKWSRQLFIQIATAWLSFLGYLAESPDDKENVFSVQVEDFIAYLRDERGLSPSTVRNRRWHVENFLRHVSLSKASIASISVNDVDAFLEFQRSRRLAPRIRCNKRCGATVILSTCRDAGLVFLRNRRRHQLAAALQTGRTSQRSSLDRRSTPYRQHRRRRSARHPGSRDPDAAGHIRIEKWRSPQIAPRRSGLDERGDYD